MVKAGGCLGLTACLGDVLVRHQNRGGSAGEDIRLGECSFPASTILILGFGSGTSGHAALMLAASSVLRIQETGKMSEVVRKEVRRAKEGERQSWAGA